MLRPLRPFTRQNTVKVDAHSPHWEYMVQEQDFSARDDGEGTLGMLDPWLKMEGEGLEMDTSLAWQHPVDTSQHGAKGWFPLLLYSYEQPHGYIFPCF